ncbi:MAG TPA: hypothetical protein VM843_00920 [Flavisolibacter sp.]|nr:hypothetical protein [Flavisolibacter sp.]
MRRSTIIQKPLAVVALLLLLLSAAPKKFLHDLVANHQDFYSALPGDEPGVSNTGFDCHIHDLVVSTPFLITNFSSSVATSAQYASHTATGYDFYFVHTSSTKDSRGPPALS